MNETIKTLLNRRSIRKFKSDAVSKELIAQVAEAGIYAASGMGKQSATVVAITNKGLRDRISEMNRKIGGWDEGFDPPAPEQESPEAMALRRERDAAGACDGAFAGAGS